MFEARISCSGGACGNRTEDPFPMLRGLNVSTDLRRGWYNLLPTTRIAGVSYFALVGAQLTKVKMNDMSFMH